MADPQPYALKCRARGAMLHFESGISVGRVFEGQFCRDEHFTVARFGAKDQAGPQQSPPRGRNAG